MWMGIISAKVLIGEHFTFVLHKISVMLLNRMYKIYMYSNNEDLLAIYCIQINLLYYATSLYRKILYCAVFLLKSFTDMYNILFFFGIQSEWL